MPKPIVQAVILRAEIDGGIKIQQRYRIASVMQIERVAYQGGMGYQFEILLQGFPHPFQSSLNLVLAVFHH
jgi:hypothetical protein